MTMIRMESIGCCREEVSAEDLTHLVDKVVLHTERAHPERAWALTVDRMEEMRDTIQAGAGTVPEGTLHEDRGGLFVSPILDDTEEYADCCSFMGR